MARSYTALNPPVHIFRLAEGATMDTCVGDMLQRLRRDRALSNQASLYIYEMADCGPHYYARRVAKDELEPHLLASMNLTLIRCHQIIQKEPRLYVVR